MTTHPRLPSPVQRQIQAYREENDSWVGDHAEVQDCWVWEDRVAVGLKCGELVETVTAAWRDRVFRGIEPADEAGNESHRALHDLWLTVTERMIASVEAGPGQSFAVEGADTLRLMAQRFRQALDVWKAPKLSTLVGLREITLSQDAADNLERYLAEAKVNPTPMPTGPVMREMSKEEFFLKLKRG